MTKLTNRYYGASLVALAFSLNAVNVNAQTCTTAPSCDTLGFTKSATDCEGHSILKCPFDQTKFYCDSGASGSGGGSDCDIGDVLYSDKTCSRVFIPRKTPIGVVFDKERRLAVALEEKELMWTSSVDKDISGLPNHYETRNEDSDFSGKNNTKIVNEECRSSCPAFKYVSDYQTEGTNAGDWYLPAFGELKALCNTADIINTILGEMVEDPQQMNVGAYEIKQMNGAYWSSSEWSKYVALDLIIPGCIKSQGQNKGPYYYDRSYGYARPVLAF